jgi:rSAM/selenodomain-associated transferase 2
MFLVMLVRHLARKELSQNFNRQNSRRLERDFKMISIIIPTLNEERSLPGLLDAIQQQGAEHEVIVVDGGSQDRTREVARARKVQTFVSLPGRGAAVCIGARESRGELLLFLHADSTLLPGALDQISNVLSSNPKIIGGNFRLIFDGDTSLSRWLTRLCALIRFIGLYYGDSGIFVRRSVYEAVAGFRPIPLFEDLDFVRRLERFGQTCCIKDPPLITSSRRFEGRRPHEIFFGWARLHLLLWSGVSPYRLAEVYRTQVPPLAVGGERVARVDTF